jgi:hypothetical protein
MDAVFANIFLRLQEEVAVDVPEIFHVNLDLGQLEFYPEDGRPPVQMPCLLVDFETPFIPRQKGAQWGDITMKLRLAFDPLSDTSNLAPDEVKVQGLQYFEIENKLYTKLQFWDAGGLVTIKPFERTFAVTEKRPDPFRVRAINFNGQYEDLGAA